MTYGQAVTEAIHVLRHRMSLTAADVERAAKIGRGRLSMRRHGTRMDTMERIATALGVRPSQVCLLAESILDGEHAQAEASQALDEELDAARREPSVDHETARKVLGVDG